MTLQPKLIFNMNTEQQVSSLFTGVTYISNEAVNASYNFSAAEIDLLIKIIWKVKKNNSEAGQIENCSLKFSYSEILPNATGSDYQELRKAFLGLMQKPIEIYYKEIKAYYISNFLNYALLTPSSGMISIGINARMVTLFLDISQNFTGIEIESLLRLKGKYSKRLYILLMQFKTTGIRFCSVDQIRKLFKLEDKYNKIADIKKRVLDPAINEICFQTECLVGYESNKAGRNIAEICFTIKLKESAAALSGDSRQREFMKKCGVSDWMITNAVNTLDPAELHRILYHVSTHQNTIKNKGAYISKMLAGAGVNTKQKINFGQYSTQ